MRLFRKITIVFLVSIGAGIIGLVASPFGQKLVPVGTAFAAKQVCSLVFVSGLEVDRARKLYVDPVISDLVPYLSVEVGDDQKRVDATGVWIIKKTAAYRPGLGCTLVQSDQASLENLKIATVEPAQLHLETDHRDAIFDGNMLDAALDTAFLDEPNSNPKNTLAVVVLHDGKLVAERYAPDIAPYTPLPGWSMAKSVTATLAGILVREGLLDVYEPGALAEWRGLSDARAAIAMDHLLRMTSGLEITEESSPYDINSRMLFLESDAAAFASEQDLAWDVGSHYEYMSGSSVLAMRRIQEIVGEGLQGSYDFVQKELFTPVKMSAAVLEPDASGTFIGSSFMLASPHDWARLGQLYLDRGVIGDLELIESSWISYVTSHTEQAGGVPYGAGVWISSNHAVEAQVNSGELPPDAINFDGFQGQFVFVIPSSGLVIVRLGATYAANPGIRDLVLGVLDAKLSGSTTAN